MVRRELSRGRGRSRLSLGNGLHRRWFQPRGVEVHGQFYNSRAAFLWMAAGSNVVKFLTLAGGSAVLFNYATAGPCFGAADFVIIGLAKVVVMGGFAGPDAEDFGVSAGSLRLGQWSLGGAYQADGRCPIQGNFALANLKVYCNNFE